VATRTAARAAHACWESSLLYVLALFLGCTATSGTVDKQLRVEGPGGLVLELGQLVSSGLAGAMGVSLARPSGEGESNAGPGALLRLMSDQTGEGSLSVRGESGPRIFAGTHTTRDGVAFVTSSGGGSQVDLGMLSAGVAGLEGRGGLLADTRVRFTHDVSRGRTSGLYFGGGWYRERIQLVTIGDRIDIQFAPRLGNRGEALGPVHISATAQAAALRLGKESWTGH
jgi:hypothetical protein